MRVLVTGVFDLLHVEHVRFLAAAKNQIPNSKLQTPSPEGNYLIVGIEPDERVRELKEVGRPIIGEEERLEIIKAIEYVDETFIIPKSCNNAEGWKKLLRDTKADVYAVSENSPHMESKKNICRELGVELKAVSRANPSVSTSRIIKKIKLMGDKGDKGR